MASTIPLHFKFKLWSNPHPNTHLDVIAVRKRINRRSPTASFYSTQQHHLLHRIFNPKSKSIHTVLTRVSSDGGGIVDAASQQSASEDVSITRNGFSNELLQDKKQEIMLDSNISQSRHIEAERGLARWVLNHFLSPRSNSIVPSESGGEKVGMIWCWSNMFNR